MRIFSAALLHETLIPDLNKTKKQNFEKFYLVYDGKHSIENAWLRPIRCWSELCVEHGHEFLESLAAAAMPSGPIEDEVYQEFSEYITQSLAKTHQERPVDCILLYLHGAMVTTKDFDCEGMLLEKVRKIVSNDIPIGVLMDLHGHQTGLKTKMADALLYFHEYPHIDLEQRAVELFKVMIKAANKEVKLAHAVFPTKVLNHMITLDEPMRNIVDFMKSQINPEEGIELASIAHGFPWADVPESGISPVVVYNTKIPQAKERAEALAETLGLILYAMRHYVKPKTVDLEKVLSNQIQLHHQSSNFFQLTQDKKPLVLADYADNPGGGALGCSTFLLHEVLNKQVPSIAFSSIWDEKAVLQVFSAKLNELMILDIGGAPNEQEIEYYGKPLRLQVTIKSICENLVDEFAGKPVSKGKAAHLSIMSYFNGEQWLAQKDCDLIINELRDQTYSPKCFEAFNINPAKKDILIVKSMYHYQAAFRKITDIDKIFTVSCAGRLTPNFATIHYQNLEASEMWPFVETINEYEEKLMEKKENKDPLLMKFIEYIEKENIKINFLESKKEKMFCI